MRQLFIRALVRSAAGLTAVALFPHAETAARFCMKHAKAGMFEAVQAAKDTRCAAGHGFREYRRVARTLRKAAAMKPKEMDR